MAANLEKLLNELRLQIRSDNNIAMAEQEERITTSINKNINEKFEHVKKEIEELQENQTNQEKRLDLVEKQVRIKNLIFFGVGEDEKSYEELEEKLVTIISNMGIKCDKYNLEVVRRMGKRTQGKIRPINVTFTTYGIKLLILKNKKALENTNIYIKEDFPPKILEVRRSLQDQLQKEREEGKIAYIRYDKIVIKEQTQINRNSKKRELVISPPQNTTNLSGISSGTVVKYQKAKKNKIVKDNQSSIKSYVQKYKEPTASTPSTPTTINIEENNQ